MRGGWVDGGGRIIEEDDDDGEVQQHGEGILQGGRLLRCTKLGNFTVCSLCVQIYTMKPQVISHPRALKHTPCPAAIHLAGLDGRVLAVIRRARPNLNRLITRRCPLVLGANLLDIASTNAGRNGSRVAVVGVDADERLAIVGLDVLDADVAQAHLAAVAAAAVELAKVDGGEAVDGDGAQAVVLDDLVVGVLGAAALDAGVAVAFDGEGVLADVYPPDVLDGARALAAVSRSVYTHNRVY